MNIHVTERTARAAADSGRIHRVWPEDFDPQAAWSLAGTGSRQPSGWTGVDVVSGQVSLEPNRLLGPGQWWGQQDSIGTNERMVREDPVLQAMNLAMTLPILSGKWTVEDVPDADAMELEAADFLRTALFENLHADGGWQGWLEQAVQFMRRGFQPFELYWPFDKELGRTLLGMRPLMPWTVEDWLPEADGRYGIRQWASNEDRPVGSSAMQSSKGATLTADELLNLRYMPEGDNPSPMGAFRSCWGDWMARSTFRKLEAQGYTRYAYPTPVIKVDPTVRGFDGTDATVSAVNRAAQNYRAGVYAANMMPVGYSIEEIEFKFDGDQIREAIVAKGHAMLTSVHATFLRTGETKGALSLHDGQVQFFSLGLQQAANKIASDLSVGRHAPTKRLLAKNFPDLRRFPVVKAPEIRIGDPAAYVKAVVEAEAAGSVVDSDRSVEDRLRDVMALPPRPEPEDEPETPDEDEVDEEIAEEQDAAPEVASKPADDEVDDETAEEQETAATERLTLADVSADRFVTGPRGRPVRAAEEVVRYSETLGATNAGKEEQARIIADWRERIADGYGKELSTAPTLEDAMLRPVPGKKDLVDALEANLRRSYTAGRMSVQAEADRLESDPALQAKIAKGDAEVGEGGDIPAPERLSEHGCGCGCCHEPLSVPLSLAERMALAPYEPSDGMALAKKRKRKVKAPDPADGMPESDLDDIDPEASIFSVAATTAVAAVDRVKQASSTALQGQGRGGAMPDSQAVRGIVRTAVTALSSGPDMNQGQADVNTLFGLGRAQELRAEGAGRYLYSALLESDSCDPCLSHDGETFGPEELSAYLTPAGWCDSAPGGNKCNCLLLCVGVPA